MPARILVVEPASDVRDVVADALRGQGYSVTVVSSGEECLEIACSEHVDLICLEVLLPGLDGFETVEQLLSRPATRDIPFVFLTEQGSLDDRVRGLRLGAHAYLTRPFALPELLAAIEGILRRSQQRLAALGVVGLMGSLSDVGIGAVLQAIEHEQRTGLLTITSGSKWGRVGFSTGRIVGAEVGKAHGEAAIFELVRWHEGSYAFRPQSVPPGPALAESLASILVRAYQEYDEHFASTAGDGAAAKPPSAP
jgi:DNA-binding response OmpR family regulator